MPRSYSEWLTLPGVGPYTAAAIASIAYGEPVGVVDGNVERVLSRIFALYHPLGDPFLKKLAKSLVNKLVDPENPGDFNQGLMELGQTVCKPQNPLCPKCPVAKMCLAYHRNAVALSPGVKPAMALEDVAMHLVVPTRGSQVGLYQRTDQARFLKGCRGFLTYVKRPTGEFCLDGRKLEINQLDTPAHTFRHAITKHRITVDVVVASDNQTPKDLELTWHEADALDPLLVSSLDRKAWKAIRNLQF
jgi:A/G-specific adenine glycosylase